MEFFTLKRWINNRPQPMESMGDIKDVKAALSEFCLKEFGVNGIAPGEFMSIDWRRFEHGRRDDLDIGFGNRLLVERHRVE